MNRMLVYLIALSGFLAGSAELIVSGVLSSIAEDLHISIALAGQLVTAYSLAFAIGTPVIIALTSRLPRKEVMAGSLALFMSGSLISFWSDTFALMIVSRIILGVSAGVYMVVALGSIAKLVPQDQIGRAIGMIALGFSLAMALGVPVGVVIADRWSWQMIFLLLALISLPVFIALMRLLPPIEGDAKVPWSAQLAVLKRPAIIGSLVISMLSSMSNSIILTYMTPYLRSIYDATTSDVGLIMLSLGLFGVLGSRLGGSSVDRYGARRMLLLTLAGSMLPLALLPFAGFSLIAGLALIIIWMTAVFMSAPALNTYIIQHSSGSSNLVLSLNTSIIHAGLAAGAGAGGLLADEAGSVQYHPWLGSITVAIALAIGILSISLNRPAHVREAVPTGE